MYQRQSCVLLRRIPSKEVWLVTYNHEDRDSGAEDHRDREYVEFVGPLPEKQYRRAAPSVGSMISHLTNTAPFIVTEEDTDRHNEYPYPDLAESDWEEVQVLTSRPLDTKGE